MELGFYFADMPDGNAFGAVCAALTRQGAVLGKRAFVHNGHAVATQPFASIHDMPLEEVAFSPSDMQSLMADSDTRLVQIALDDVFGDYEIPTPALLTYSSISDEASQQDHHPISVWLSGIAFDPIPELEAERQALGERVYALFTQLARALSPTYAAITFEYALECLTDLKRDPRSLAFRNFYVANDLLGDNQAALIGLYTGAYIEPLPDGVYISCTAEFNPGGKHIPFEKGSKTVRLIIANG